MVCEGLQHCPWGILKDPRVVEPLIAALKDENEYVLMNAAFSLGKVTEKYFGYDHAKWQAWWAENKNRQSVSPAKQVQQVQQEQQ